MATSLKNLSEFDKDKVPSAKGMRFGIVVAEWNSEITFAMANGAQEFLVKNGAKEKDIIVKTVPGSFELIAGCKWMAEYGDVEAVIAIGTIIQGETRHFDFICQGVTYGLSELNMAYDDIPFIFGVLTTDNIEQAIDRAGGKHGNKGVEAAYTAIKMVALNKSMTDE